MMDAVMVVEMVEYLGLNEVALPDSERVVTLAWYGLGYRLLAGIQEEHAEILVQQCIMPVYVCIGTALYVCTGVWYVYRSVCVRQCLCA